MNPHLLTGVYSVDALPEAEQAEFETHLAECDACAQEVVELAETVSRLGIAVAHLPSHELDVRVLAGLRTERQLRPLTSPELDFARRQGIRRAAWAIAASGLVVAMVFGVHGMQSSQRLTTALPDRGWTRTVDNRISGFPAASDLLFTRSMSSGASCTVAVSRAQDTLFVLADRLPSLPPGHVYQVWLVGAADPRSGGVLPRADRPAPLVVAGISGVLEVLLTVEPLGGSTGPTSAPLLAIALA